MIRTEIDLNTPITDTQNAMLNALKNRPVEPDEDCPALTDEQLAQFKILEAALDNPEIIRRNL